MFEETIAEMFEPESGLAVNGPIFLAKEDNKTSEQTFSVVVQTSSSVPPGQGIQPASLGVDYSLGGATSMVLQFLPKDERINFQFTLFPDQLSEGTEAFQASSAPGEGEQMPFPLPTFLNPITLTAEAFIIIEDDDCKFDL